MKRVMDWIEESATLVFPKFGGQEDVRLDGLFVALALAISEEDAKSVEAKIWSIWSDSGNAEINELMQQGTTELHRDNAEAALEIYDQVIEKMPGFAEGWNKRATIHYLLGDVDASISDVERTLALEPRHFGALSGLGLIALAIGQEEQALEAFEAALEIHPFLPGADTHIKDLREKLGRS